MIGQAIGWLFTLGGIIASIVVVFCAFVGDRKD
jgi:hypothetical protein